MTFVSYSDLSLPKHEFCVTPHVTKSANEKVGSRNSLVRNEGLSDNTSNAET